jgi:hypothetical protein
LALAVFAPVPVWNALHGWASFAFQGDRAVGLRFHPLAPVVTLAGEALFVLPWFWLPMMMLAFSTSLFGGRLEGVGGASGASDLDPPPSPTPLPRGEGANFVHHRRLLICLAAPPIVLFALISAWSSQRVLFHWAAPGYLMLFPLLGQWAAQHADRAWLRRTTIATAALAIGAMAVIGSQARLDWLATTIGATARHDPTIEGIDWTSLRTELTARGQLHPGSVVGVPNWRDAGKIAYALGPDVTVLCLNRDSRQFGFADPPSAYLGRDVLLLVADHADRVVPQLAKTFRGIETLAPATIELRGRVLRTIAVYQGQQLLAWP